MGHSLKCRLSIYRKDISWTVPEQFRHEAVLECPLRVELVVLWFICRLTSLLGLCISSLNWAPYGSTKFRFHFEARLDTDS